MSRPDPKDIFAQKPGLFSWMRDRAYDFALYEIGAGLDFVGDLFRGPSGYSGSLHRQAEKVQTRNPTAKPLTKAEQAQFVAMLKRQPPEGQVDYWKRKKALLGNPDKQHLVAQQCALDAILVHQQSKKHPNITVEAPTLSQSPFRSQSRKQVKARSRR